MASVQPGRVSAIKDISVIVVCVLASIALLLLIYYALSPTSKMMQMAEEETLVKVNSALDSFAALNSNVLELTGRDYVEDHFVLPLDHIQLSMMEVAANLIIFTDVLTDSFVNLNYLISTYNALGSNLYQISDPEYLERTVYQPLHTTITQTTLLVEKLTVLADDISVATAPMRLTRALPLHTITSADGALPLLSALTQPGSAGVASRVIAIFDDLMVPKGFNADITPRDVVLDPFNAVQQVTVATVSLSAAGTNMFAKPLEHFADNLEQQGISREEYLKWYYAIAALQELPRYGIGVVEELDHIIRRLPAQPITPELLTPELLANIKNDPLVKKLPQYLSIKKCLPVVWPEREPIGVE